MTNPRADHRNRMSVQILPGDCRETLRTLAPASVQCCVTSPPYWGLRDYQCAGQLGLESTPELYVAAMVAVFREVRRVLADDGTLWLNLGSNYFGSNQTGGTNSLEGTPKRMGRMFSRGNAPKACSTITFPVFKAKDLVPIPWMVAMALQADGWWLRSDIIWHKPNPMPESVTDRPTKAHEYIFLLTKSASYYYDAAAIAEPTSDKTVWTYAQPDKAAVAGLTTNGTGLSTLRTRGETDSRNKRTVWTVPTSPYPGAHFATFPPDLIKPCILAGSRAAGKRCDCDQIIATPTGSGPINDPSFEVGRAGFSRPRRPDEGTRPITRREQRSYAEQMRVSPFRAEMATAAGEAFAHYIRTDASGARPAPDGLLREWMGRGWLCEPEPCRCPMHPADTVLDPFFGAGTTGKVALELGRRCIGIELNPQYLELSNQRCNVTLGLPFA